MMTLNIEILELYRRNKTFLARVEWKGDAEVREGHFCVQWNKGKITPNQKILIGFHIFCGWQTFDQKAPK